jgi:hypothetical protein
MGWLVVCMLGCATGPQELASPRIRVGGLPYPGLTFYLALERPVNLGAHRYQLMRGLGDQSDEVSGGIVYTRHAGFIDMAHVRSTIDWVRYVYLVTLQGLMSADPSLQPPLRWHWLGMDYQMHIRAPKKWTELPESRRTVLAQEAAKILAQRLATSISTWHEIGSWHGQMIVPPIQEIRSAFTWDDTSSHVLAALVGAGALSIANPHLQEEWNMSVTRELGLAMAALVPVDLDCQNQALARSQGLWWSGGQTLRRDLDTGLQGPEPKRPWLVQGLQCADVAALAAARTALPWAFQLPDWRELEQSTGLSFESWFDWEVTMPNWLAERVRGCGTSCAPHVFRGEADLLRAIEQIRTQVEQQSGAKALRQDESR